MNKLTLNEQMTTGMRSQKGQYEANSIFSTDVTDVGKNEVLIHSRGIILNLRCKRNEGCGPQVISIKLHMRVEQVTLSCQKKGTDHPPERTGDPQRNKTIKSILRAKSTEVYYW